ncbi:hypothetical protein B0H14DRAFT_3435850 [Mycena olivaceomarginata]|nr:hypothetical protein B0H14DRAFT_3435850 [Mycena olivaceomarginata]
MNAAQTLILDLVPSQSLPVCVPLNSIELPFTGKLIQLKITSNCCRRTEQPRTLRAQRRVCGGHPASSCRSLGAGWTYVLLAGMCVVVSPLIYIVIPYWATLLREEAEE